MHIVLGNPWEPTGECTIQLKHKERISYYEGCTFKWGSGLYRNANTVKYKECRNKCCRSKETKETRQLDDYQSRPAWALQKGNAISWEKGGATVTYTRLSHHTATGRSGLTSLVYRSTRYILGPSTTHNLYIHSLSPKILRSSAHTYSQILHKSMHMN